MHKKNLKKYLLNNCNYIKKTDNHTSSIIKAHFLNNCKPYLKNQHIYKQ